MLMLVCIGAAAFFVYSAIVFIDVSTWGLPRIKREQRLRCLTGDCTASFVCRYEDWNAAARAVEMHQRAAHQDDDSPQLWPRALPKRNRDFSTRQARVVQDVGDESDVMIINGLRVRVLKGGKDGRASTGRSR